MFESRMTLLLATLSLIFAGCIRAGVMTKPKGNELEEPIPCKDHTETVMTSKQHEDLEFIAHLKLSDQAEVWALYSTGGAANDGQFLIIRDDTSQIYDFYYTPPGHKSERLKKNIGKVALNKFASDLRNADTETLDHHCKTVFDAFRYAYKRFSIKSDGTPDVERSLYIMAPGVPEASQPHLNLIAPFKALRTSFQ